MDQKQIIKWVLIGVGAYLVYRWISSSGILGGTSTVPAGTGATALPAGAAATTAAPGTTTPATTVTPPAQAVPPASAAPTVIVPTSPASTPTVDQLMAAASDQSKVGLVGDYLLSPWQWNYYRGQYFTTVLNQPFDKATMTPDFPASVDGNAPVTASAYWAILRSIGLSGMGWGNGLSYGVSRPWGFQ